MDNERHAFIRSDRAACHLRSSAVERIISRGLGQPMRKELTHVPILPLVHSEPRILCSDVDVSTRGVAFGRWAIPKLKRELLSSDPVTSKRAVLSLLDMVHDPEKAVEAVRLQVVPRLARLLKAEDPFVRQHVCMVIEVLAMQPHGKLVLVRHQVIMDHLVNLLSDDVNSVRLSAANAARALATWYLGVDDMVKDYFIPVIINRLDIELDDQIMPVLLETLEMLLDEDMAAKQQGLKMNGMELAVLLEHSSAAVRAGAAAVIAQLVRHPDGKQALLRHKADILALLSPLLDDSDDEVKAKAAAALMFVLSTTEAKHRCLALGTLPALLRCAQIHSRRELQLNSIVALTSLAESPQGRDILKAQPRLTQDIRPADNVVRVHKGNLLEAINRVI